MAFFVILNEFYNSFFICKCELGIYILKNRWEVLLFKSQMTYHLVIA